MNLDFTLEPLFSWYVLLLLLSGVAMFVMAFVNTARQSIGWRIFGAVAGLGFVGYGVYLGFLFEGGTYIIFFKAFIVPIVVIAQFVRSLMANGAQKVAA
jgi:hypothetical protein